MYIHVNKFCRKGQIFSVLTFLFRVAQDTFLWKELFYWYWMIDPTVPVKDPSGMPFQKEYKRLYYHSPLIESEILKAHRDQVLHVSFSHNGQWFATCSKDGFVKVILIKAVRLKQSGENCVLLRNPLKRLCTSARDYFVSSNFQL